MTPVGPGAFSTPEHSRPPPNQSQNPPPDLGSQPRTPPIRENPPGPRTRARRSRFSRSRIKPHPPYRTLPESPPWFRRPRITPRPRSPPVPGHSRPRTPRYRPPVPLTAAPSPPPSRPRSRSRSRRGGGVTQPPQFPRAEAPPRPRPSNGNTQRAARWGLHCRPLHSLPAVHQGTNRRLDAWGCTESPCPRPPAPQC